MSTPYRQGRILWARLRAQSGKKEPHPAVIITADRDIVQPQQFDPRKNLDQVNAVAVVGVSTKYARYKLPHVRLPFLASAGGHAITKLKEDCAACIGWYDWVVLEDDVIGRGGDVPPAELDQIMQLIAKDLGGKLTAKLKSVGREMNDLHELLAALIGEP